MTLYRNGDSRSRLHDNPPSTVSPSGTDLGEKGSAGPAWIAFIDRQERVQFINPAYCRQLRRDRRELLGRPAREVFGEEAYEVSQSLLRAAFEGEPQRQEIHRPLPDGRGVIVRESHWEPAEDASGEVIGCFLIELDVTERHQWELQLLEARRAAEAASEAKSRFVAQMNHEIRTPMAAMLGYVEILARREEDPEKLHMLNTVRRNGDLLTEIVNDILDLAKIEAGKMEIVREKFDLDDLLADINGVIRLRAEEKQIDFTICHEGTVPEVVDTDRTRLRQILINLLGNAIKFTDEGEVQLIIRGVDASPDRLRFEVADTGIGVTPKQIDSLFVPFSQADASITETFGGTGLGLSISRRLAELLDGSIEVSSVPGKGSIFSCEVGIGTSSSLRSQAASDSKSSQVSADVLSAKLPLHGMCVLVVDDRREARLLVQHLLTDAGATVRFATDGVEALEAVRDSHQLSRQIDAVLLDMQMPRLDGYEAAVEMRTLGFQKPIVALTADALEEDRKRCLAAGCNNHIRKPVDADELIEVLAGYLQPPAMSTP